MDRLVACATGAGPVSRGRPSGIRLAVRPRRYRCGLPGRIVPYEAPGTRSRVRVAARAEEVSAEVGIVRPIFEPGDVLLFDELFLHSTAAEPDMPNPRYAVESWFFGPSGFPRQYAPLAF